MTTSPSELDMAQALEAVALRLRMLSATESQPGLTAMRALASIVELGPQRIGDLATREGVTQPTMTALVSRLVSDGLVERRADPGDRRAVRVAVTAAGRALLKRRREARAAHMAELVEQLSAPHRRALAQAVPALRALAELKAT